MQHKNVHSFEYCTKYWPELIATEFAIVGRCAARHPGRTDPPSSLTGWPTRILIPTVREPRPWAQWPPGSSSSC